MTDCPLCSTTDSEAAIAKHLLTDHAVLVDEPPWLECAWCGDPLSAYITYTMNPEIVLAIWQKHVAAKGGVQAHYLQHALALEKNG